MRYKFLTAAEIEGEFERQYKQCERSHLIATVQIQFLTGKTDDDSAKMLAMVQKTFALAVAEIAYLDTLIATKDAFINATASDRS